MNAHINFSDELRTWILHNLRRGCAPGDLVASMIEQKFEPEIAKGLINAFQLAITKGIEPPSTSVMLDLGKANPVETFLPDYQYETPRLASTPIICTSDRDIPVLMRVAQPIVAILDGVLSAQECDQLIELARNRLQPSTVVDPATGKDKIAEHRNSYGMFFELQETPFIAMLDKRISEIMNCPIENGEGLQVLHYGPNTKNTPHFDFLVPSNAANQQSLERSGQRVSSLVIYLNDVTRGGETIFPEVGLSVSPKKGNAVYFEYTNSLHQVDHKSLHAGAEVHEGEKWIVTKWMREKRFVPAGKL